MELSVVVPTLNGRDRLVGCLDALAEHLPEAEVVVVNGPSADGTTGTVQERDDVDVLVEIAERNGSVARNAGLATAQGDVVAVVGYDREVDPTWLEGLRSGLQTGADVVTGPTRGGPTDPDVAPGSVAGPPVTHCNGENVALTREAIRALDGFDEYLAVGGARDISHRIAALDLDLAWEPRMSVQGPYGADGGVVEPDRRELYRSLSYRLVKNYGLRPGVLVRVFGEAGIDAGSAARGVLGGQQVPSSWFGHGRDAIAGIAAGVRAGAAARLRDRSTRRNPNGISSRRDRAIQAYDWR